MFHTFDINFLHSFVLKITKVTCSFISSFFIAAVEGYIHLLSPIKKAANSGNTNYFDCKLQTSNDKSVRLVCYFPNRTSDILPCCDFA